MHNRQTVVMVGIVISHLFCQNDEGKGTEVESLRVKLVDASGDPVAKAHVGVICLVGDAARELIAEQKSQTEWFYDIHAQSDAHGYATMEVASHLLSRCCVIARHEQLGLLGIASVDPSKVPKVLHMILVPEQSIAGEVTCKDLNERRRELGHLRVTLRYKGKNAVDFECANSSIRFVAPPGTYEIEIKGKWTHSVRETIIVKDQSKIQYIDLIDLPAVRLIMLQGKPAPELSHVIVWKNSKPLELSELRGSFVLLDFWGYWCGPCVHQMPELFRLFDKYHDKGLAIVGVHCDIADSTEERVDSVESLDNRLSEARDKIWGGRDIPFPIAIVAAEKTEFGGRMEGWTHSKSFADYGIKLVPQQVLIDRNGNVMRAFDVSDGDDRRFLEKILEE